MSWASLNCKTCQARRNFYFPLKTIDYHNDKVKPRFRTRLALLCVSPLSSCSSWSPRLAFCLVIAFAFCLEGLHLAFSNSTLVTLATHFVVISFERAVFFVGVVVHSRLDLEYELAQVPRVNYTFIVSDLDKAWGLSKTKVFKYWYEFTHLTAGILSCRTEWCSLRIWEGSL